MMAPQMCSGTGVHQHPTSPGQPGSAQCRVGTIKKGLAGLHWHGAAGSRYLILAGMHWGHAGPCCGGLAPACYDGGVDVGSGRCIHRWRVSPELVSPWDIATMPRYEDAAGSGVFTCHQPHPCTSTLGTPWAPSPASHTLPLHQGHGGHLRPPCATVTHSPFPALMHSRARCAGEETLVHPSKWQWERSLRCSWHSRAHLAPPESHKLQWGVELGTGSQAGQG